MIGTALLVRFLLELSLVAMAGWYPVRVMTGWPAICVSFAMVSALLVFWGAFLSPKRHVELGACARLAAELVLFSLAAGALHSAGFRHLAAALILLEVIDKAVLVRLEGRL